MNYTPLPDSVCKELIQEFFLALNELKQEVAPKGFQQSDLVHVFHPTAETEYKEYRSFHLRMGQLESKLKKPIGIPPPKSFEEFLNERKEISVEEEYELISILGDCLWDIFSNNHTVFNNQMQSYDLGSWRGSGGFIADVINDLQLLPDKQFDYLEFYMGSYVAKDRANLIPVYEFIFKKLKSKDLYWEFSFPRMDLIRFNREEEENMELTEYDPAVALQKQMKKEQEQKEFEELQETFDKSFLEAYEKAKYEKPSQEVLAYFHIYGHWPKGHPLAEV